MPSERSRSAWPSLMDHHSFLLCAGVSGCRRCLAAHARIAKRREQIKIERADMNDVMDQHPLPQSRALRPVQRPLAYLLRHRQRHNIRASSTALYSSVKRDVCFTPKSGHCRATVGCPLCANSRHRSARSVESVISNG
jgi:hypothetical protein